MGLQPGPRGATQPSLLIGSDHVGRVPEPDSRLLLDLAEDEPPAPANDDVQLVPSRPRVRCEDAIATQAVPPRSAPLRRVHATERNGGMRCTLQGVSAKFATALIAAAALALVASAQAKAPPGGVDLCGADGSCLRLATQDAETNWAFWAPPSMSEDSTTSGVAPFLLVHWHWDGQPEQTAYYVPSTGKVRQVDANGFRSWFNVADAQRIRSLTASLAPYPAPLFSSVTVGGKPVADPQSYAKLFSVGHEWLPWQYPRFIRVRFASDTPSPWTDSHVDVRISRTGRLLWVDGTTFRIPLQLAQRIRARRSLGS
jgi:hypothetical protein